MRSVFYLVAALAATCVSSSVLSNLGHQCGTKISPEAVLNAERLLGKVNGTADKSAVVPVQVIWHVIAKDSTVQGGNIPDGLIQQQIYVSNQDFARANAGIAWQLVGIDRTVNPDWAGGSVGDGTQAEYAMKTTLRKGNAAVLNVYSVVTIAGAPPGYSLDGYATFPWDFNGAPWKDGIVLATYALPGGPIPARGYGRTLSHEAGHWVGLYHTFQGGCTAPGDYVDDTPFEASPASGCPQGRDTCPQPGLDPITNYMDYTDDLCRTGLTPGQVARLQAAVRQFRGIPA